MKRFWGIVLMTLGVGAVIGGSWWYLNDKEEFLRPLVEAGEKWGVFEKRHFEVVGFLPPWTIKKTKLHPEALDQLIFLGVAVEGNGDLIWDSDAQSLYSREYLTMKEEMKKAGKKNILGLKLFEDEKIDQLMGSKTAQKRLMGQVEKLVEEEGFDGVNIDFEYAGDHLGVLRDKFLGFLKDFSEAKVGELSLDVYGNTIIKGDMERWGEVAELLDYVIIMAYDFHRPGSDWVGPVAPIRAGGGERSVLDVLEAAWELGIPKEKLIVALPLYGYEWKTVGEEYGAAVRRGWYAMASYNRMRELVKEEGIEVNWDSLSMSPWVVYKDEGVTKQIYYENLQSLSAKYRLVKESQLGGVGFWALGYEGEHDDVWEELVRQLK
jgi:spore germination protein